MAPMRQGVEEKVAMEDLKEELKGVEGEIFLAGRKMRGRKQGQVVAKESPRKLLATRSGKNSRGRRSPQDSSCSCDRPSLKLSQVQELRINM